MPLYPAATASSETCMPRQLHVKISSGLHVCGVEPTSLKDLSLYSNQHDYGLAGQLENAAQPSTAQRDMAWHIARI